MNNGNAEWRLPEDLHRCPTCGRFGTAEEGYADLPPGGHWVSDYITPYCNEQCAERKPGPPCVYEDDQQ